ncbi:hypothetical protein [Paraflavitalea sp. CAU 1676]|uniref:hypothetical protein n=1 Tax=Paraflavitalea sp. CAU 1676 TaxID=3032598 RepID=UPI0023DCE752|nr:hypothetical protein [Paraflavitalea sp. CAU 1676]MDF2191882.1 hypothetical protein [Paraflavitalea sp. CAU 1676]
MKILSLIVVATFLCCTNVSARCLRDTAVNNAQPSLEVVYLGAEGDDLLFTVKSDNVSAKTIFAIRNEAGDDIYRTWQSDANAIRRIRIPRSTVRTLHFILGSRKQQCIKTFTINTSIVETVQVKEKER